MSVDHRRHEIMSRLPEGECRMAEIGVWNGALASELLQCHKRLTLLMVDRWEEVGEDHPYRLSGAKIGQATQADMERAREACERLAESRFYGDRAVPMQGESVQMAAAVEDGSLDLVFIDANHSFPGLMSDLTAWYPKVKPGGWIGGHDWGSKPAGTNWDVQGAVDTFIADNQLAPNVQLGAGNTWFLRVPGGTHKKALSIPEDALLIYCCSFGEEFHMMARWLQNSVRKNCPNAEFIHDKIQHPRQDSRYKAHMPWNTAKLHAWNDVVQSASCRVVLMDCDMIVLSDLGRAFDENTFDLAYTVRPGPHLINAGVLFVNPTDAAKAFFAEFVRINDELMSDPDVAEQAVNAYGGINQAALSAAIEANTAAALHELPCAVWNSTRQTWGETVERLKDPDAEQTVVLHVNTQLRVEVYAGREPDSDSPNYRLAPLVAIALKYKQ